MLEKQPREHDEAHLAYIRSQPCAICGDNTMVEAAHLRTGLKGVKRYTGLAEKSSDRWTIPLCGKHHRQQHTMNEREFWASYGIDPVALALHYHR